MKTTTKAAMSTDKNPARPKPSSAFSNVRDRARTTSNTDSLLITTTTTAKITNFNSDTVCLSTDSNNNNSNNKKKDSNIVTWFQRVWYSISVHNGTYMMNPTERWTIHAALFLGTAFGLLYLYVFGKGLIDGMMVAAQAAAGAASEDNDVHA